MTCVYKYYPPKDYNFDAIKDGYFFLCKAKHQNDPFELSFSLFSELTIGKGIASKKIEPLKEYGICSFTTAYDNKRMWAMYADNYSGFVVEFDDCYLEDYPQYFIDNGKLPVPKLTYEKVEYIDSLNVLESPDYRYSLNYFGNQINDKEVKLSDDPHEMEFLFIHLCRIQERKSWQQDDEIRLISGKDMYEKKDICEFNGVKYDKEDDGFKVPFDRRAVKRIICGHNMSGENIKRLIEIASSYNVKLFQIVPATVPFKLELTEI